MRTALREGQAHEARAATLQVEVATQQARASDERAQLATASTRLEARLRCPPGRRCACDTDRRAHCRGGSASWQRLPRRCRRARGSSRRTPLRSWRTSRAWSVAQRRSERTWRRALRSWTSSFAPCKRCVARCAPRGAPDPAARAAWRAGACASAGDGRAAAGGAGAAAGVAHGAARAGTSRCAASERWTRHVMCLHARRPRRCLRLPRAWRCTSQSCCRSSPPRAACSRSPPAPQRRSEERSRRPQHATPGRTATQV